MQVLADYESNAIDLADPGVYRDLSKPIGCQLSSQEAQFKERYNSWADDEIKPFHYGSHYSTAGTVLWYLVRLAPYTESALQLQGGHFDCPDRLFRNIAETFHGCTHSTTDVKELIPEFFYLPDFLVNSNGLDLGLTQHGHQVDDVLLPPWAKDAVDFVNINRQALESEHVSSCLHHWIDLIFGYKQKGKAAVEATNVYYYLTYEGEVDLEGMEDSMMRRATEAQIVNFGQTPRQLFASAHPRRLPASACARSLFSSSLVPSDALIGRVDAAGQLVSPVNAQRSDDVSKALQFPRTPGPAEERQTGDNGGEWQISGVEPARDQEGSQNDWDGIKSERNAILQEHDASAAGTCLGSFRGNGDRHGVHGTSGNQSGSDIVGSTNRAPVKDVVVADTRWSEEVAFSPLQSRRKSQQLLLEGVANLNVVPLESRHGQPEEAGQEELHQRKEPGEEGVESFEDHDMEGIPSSEEKVAICAMQPDALHSSSPLSLADRDISPFSSPGSGVPHSSPESIACSRVPSAESASSVILPDLNSAAEIVHSSTDALKSSDLVELPPGGTVSVPFLFANVFRECAVCSMSADHSVCVCVCV